MAGGDNLDSFLFDIEKKVKDRDNKGEMGDFLKSLQGRGEI